MNLEIPSIRLRHRSWPVITFIGTQWSPRWNKGQKMNKNVKFWHSLKVKPGFLIVLINLKTGATQWRAGVGRQRGTKVREAGERTREAGDSDSPVPPPPHHLHNHLQSPRVLWSFELSKDSSCSRQVCRSITSSQCLSTKLPANRRLL